MKYLKLIEKDSEIIKNVKKPTIFYSLENNKVWRSYTI